MLVPSPLSFGVEFEFVISTLLSADREQDPDPHPQDTRCVYMLDTPLVPNPPNPDLNPVYFSIRTEEEIDDGDRCHTHIANTLMRAGLATRAEMMEAWGGPHTDDDDRLQDKIAGKSKGKAIEEDGGGFHPKTQVEWTVAQQVADVEQSMMYDNYHGPSPDGSEFHVYDFSQTETKFIVSEDLTVHPVDQPAGYDFEPIEIGTPAYWFTPEALRDTRVMIETITSNYRTSVNQTCGLHVHVGNGRDGLELDICQNLMAFLYTFEPILSTLHSRRRIEDSAWCRPLRVDSNLVKFHPKAKTDLVWALGIIFETTNKQRYGPVDDLTNLAWMFETYFGKAGYRFDYMGDLSNADEAPSFKRTVEFRVHAGSLDPDAVCNWVKVCVGIVKFARDVGRSAMMELVMEHAHRERMGKPIDVYKLLRIIGLDGPAKYYAERDACN